MLDASSSKGAFTKSNSRHSRGQSQGIFKDDSETTLQYDLRRNDDKNAESMLNSSNMKSEEENGGELARRARVTPAGLASDSRGHNSEENLEDDHESSVNEPSSSKIRKKHRPLNSRSSK